MLRILTTIFTISMFFISLSVSYASSFPDVEGHVNENAIEYLHENEIISGYDDGLFRPNKEVSRAEILKILIRGIGITPNLSYYNSCFIDVGDEWYGAYICYAKSKGWINGYPDNTFKPNKTVTKIEALKMLVQSQEYTLPASVTEKPFNNIDINTWYAPYLKIASNKNLLEEVDGDFPIDEKVTRANISENIYRAMVIDRNGYGSFSNYVSEEL